jgi:anaerobic selenocysteine-containing dehydrogenase
MRDKIEIKQNDAPSGGWGSVKEVSTILLRENVMAEGTALLLHQNKPDGFACVSCAWAKPANPHPAEFCESGAKATAWEITSHTLGPDFFASHTLASLESWSDHALEEKGRLTEPMRWDAATDTYVPRAGPAGAEGCRVLQFRARVAGNVVHVPAAGAHVRQ